MLYPKKMEKLTEKLFKDPPSEYRGAPFWAWNSKLNPNELSEQIGAFKLMGMGGFHIHSRTGLAVNYLSNEFMNLVNFCNEKAKKREDALLAIRRGPLAVRICGWIRYKR